MKIIFLFIFFLVGFVFGIINPILWIVLLILYRRKDKGYPFLNQNLVKRIAIYGFIIFLIIISFLLIK